MLEALFFVAALIAVIAILHWSVTNDAAGNRRATKGFFAMRDFAAEADAAADKQRPPTLQKRR
jgi:hypothetical protein